MIEILVEYLVNSVMANSLFPFSCCKICKYYWRNSLYSKRETRLGIWLESWNCYLNANKLIFLSHLQKGWMCFRSMDCFIQGIIVSRLLTQPRDVYINQILIWCEIFIWKYYCSVVDIFQYIYIYLQGGKKSWTVFSGSRLRKAMFTTGLRITDFLWGQKTFYQGHSQWIIHYRKKQRYIQRNINDEACWHLPVDWIRGFLTQMHVVAFPIIYKYAVN